MLIRVLLAALLAGVLAGAFATAAQSVRVVPLILEAEKYETADGYGGHAHGSEASSATVSEGHGDGHAHDAGHSHDSKTATPGETGHHSVDAWAPGDGIERVFFTFTSNVIAAVAFSLILTAAILVSRQKISLKSGLVWGAAGFGSFVLAPNFGLPPELPGMEAAELARRQIWWAFTVAVTAAGLAIFAFRRHWLWMIAGVALIAMPHIYGAPQAASYDTAVPANLVAEFVVATIATSALFWLFLGGILGWLLNRSFGSEIRTDKATSL